MPIPIGSRLDLSALTVPELEQLRRQCNFTPDERAAFDLRAAGVSALGTAEALHVSERTLTRRMQGIRRKISRVL